MPRFALVLTTLSSFALPAAAHPGHGVAEQAWSLTHQLTEPSHMLPLVVMLLVGGAAAKRLRPRRAAGQSHR